MDLLSVFLTCKLSDQKFQDILNLTVFASELSNGNITNARYLPGGPVHQVWSATDKICGWKLGAGAATTKSQTKWLIPEHLPEVLTGALILTEAVARFCRIKHNMFVHKFCMSTGLQNLGIFIFFEYCQPATRPRYRRPRSLWYVNFWYRDENLIFRFLLPSSV